MESEERFARGADRAVTNREKSLKELGQAVDDVATGRVSLTTIKDEVTDKTKKLAETVTDREKLREFAKGKLAGWMTGIEDWSKKRSDDQLDDAGEITANAAIDGAVGLGMGAAGRALGDVVVEVEELKKAGKYVAEGSYGGDRAGKSFTRAGKREVKASNAAAHGGQTTCMDCGQPTVPAKQSHRGVTPPGNETHVDHIVPQAKGGNGSLDNGQILCRDCNLKKGTGAR